MDVIARTRELVSAFPEIAKICNAVHIDFTDPKPDSYGLAPAGDVLLSEDVLGNQVREHTFFLYVVYSSLNDYERLHNSSALLALSQWIEHQTGAVVDSFGGSGKMTKIRTDNGMLYDIPQEGYGKGVRYQMQIIVTYTVETE